MHQTNQINHSHVVRSPAVQKVVVMNLAYLNFTLIHSQTIRELLHWKIAWIVLKVWSSLLLKRRSQRSWYSSNQLSSVRGNRIFEIINSKRLHFLIACISFIYLWFSLIHYRIRIKFKFMIGKTFKVSDEKQEIISR